MSESMNKFLSRLGVFFMNRRNRRLLYLLAICLIALGEYLHLGLVRRTFVFYSTRDDSMVVENRFLHRSGDRETDIRRYIEEALLGPKSSGLKIPFYRGTRLLTIMYNEGVVHANFSEDAALPPPDDGTVFHNLLTLNKGVRRNFPFVKDVRIFIGGNQVFFEEFRYFFTDSADNSKT